MQVGITFDRCNVTSANDAHYHWTFLNKTNGVTKGCAVTSTSNTITIGKGYFIIFGRFVQITGDEIITPEAVTTGTAYRRLVYEIDLTKTNTDTEFNQGYFKVLSSANTTYPTLTQHDLDNGGTVYQMPFARFTQSVGGISNFVSELTMINFNDLYTQLQQVKNEYSAVIDQYVEELKNQGFITQTAYHADNTPVTISIAVNDWVYDGSNKWYWVNKPCSKASTSAYCVLHIKPIAANNKDAKRAADKAFGYIFSDPTVNDGSITFRAYAKPAVALTLSVIGGIGQ